ncbi:MAG: PAS domain-containing protein [Sphingobacteriales bacterium]|nr:PAS domain-containing protein [Sphingobacteriales bacterium]
MQKAMNILMLEDSATDAELVQRLLKKEYPQCRIQLAVTREAFLLALYQSEPDVILADNSLPQFDAREALRMVRDNGINTPFIMVSGTTTEEFAVQMIKNGADDYILKDRLIRLPAAIEAALRHQEAEREKAGALRKLVESEEKYRTIVERISDGFIVMNRGWEVTYINPAAEKLLRRPPGYLMEKNMQEEFSAIHDRPFFAAFEEAIYTGKNRYLELYSASVDRWIQASIYPSGDGIAVFFRDFSEQRKAEEEARKSEEKYRIFIQRVTDAFISLDHNWCYTYLNQQAGELIHRKPEDLIGKNVWAEFPDAVHSATFMAFNQAMNEQRYLSNVDYYAPLDLWQENHIYPSEDGISVFIRNITEKKKLELELQERQRKEQQKMIAATLEAQEKERNAIGAELHDNVNQILVGTRVLLSVLREHPDRTGEIVNNCLDNLALAILENRKIAHELVAPDLSKEDLPGQLNRLCETMLRPAGIETFLQYGEYSESELDEKRKLSLYRIAQEQCTNIIKYAYAKNVILTLSTLNGSLAFRIADDGVGAETGKTAMGIGLQNISNRLTVFGGTLQVITNPGEGFELEITMPLAENE